MSAQQKYLNKLVNIKNPKEGQIEYGYIFNKGRWSKHKEENPEGRLKQNKGFERISKLENRNKIIYIMLGMNAIISIFTIIYMFLK